ncbi:MAG TPA: ACT domain-containing protein [Candidatus Paceibacterota bacterium]
MGAFKLTISVLPQDLSVCRFGSNDAPKLPERGFYSITKTADELSVVCESDAIPPNCPKVEKGWRALKVEGPLDFSLTGILASLATPLAEAGISIFAISTYDTDYVLVKSENLPGAVEVLGRFCDVRS